MPSGLSEAFENPPEDEATTKGVKRSPSGPHWAWEENKIYTGQQQNRYLKLKFHLRLQEVYKSVKYIYICDLLDIQSWLRAVNHMPYIYPPYIEPYSWNMNAIKRMQDVWEGGKNTEWCGSSSLIAGREERRQGGRKGVGSESLCLLSVFFIYLFPVSSSSPASEPDLPLRLFFCFFLFFVVRLLPSPQNVPRAASATQQMASWLINFNKSNIN